MSDDYCMVRYYSKEYCGPMFWLCLPALIPLSIVAAALVRTYYFCKWVGSRRAYKRLVHRSRKVERCFDVWCSKLFGEQK